MAFLHPMMPYCRDGNVASIGTLEISPLLVKIGDDETSTEISDLGSLESIQQMWKGLLSDGIDITGTEDPRGKLDTAFPAAVRLFPVNGIASALTLYTSWNDPATIADLRKCLTGDVRKSDAFLEDEIKKLMRSAATAFYAFKEAEKEIFGDESGFLAWDREIESEMAIDKEVSMQKDETIMAHESPAAPTEPTCEPVVSESAHVPESPPANCDELIALAALALRVTESITPAPEMSEATPAVNKPAASDLPDLLIPPVQLEATAAANDDESPDSLGWAGSALGSPELDI
jgi:hypothetical protein